MLPWKPVKAADRPLGVKGVDWIDLLYCTGVRMMHIKGVRGVCFGANVSRELIPVTPMWGDDWLSWERQLLLNCDWSRAKKG